MRGRLTIYVDMDETIVDLVDPWLSILNGKLYKLGNGARCSLTREDCVMYDMGSVVTELSAEEVYEPLHRPGFWENLPPLNGAVRFMKRLVDQGHDVYIATIPYPSERCAWEKRLWVEKNLPFIDPETNLLMIKRKGLLSGDVIIDDNPELILTFQGKRLLFHRPWNYSLPVLGYHEGWFKRVKFYTDIINICTEISMFG